MRMVRCKSFALLKPVALVPEARQSGSGLDAVISGQPKSEGDVNVQLFAI
jgi:hypothetical protein